MHAKILCCFVILAALLGIQNPANAATLTIEDAQFKLDGQQIKIWGVRTASAVNSEENTQNLLSELGDYKAHGVNAITIFYQGSSGGYSNPFSKDGLTIDADVERRMEAIIKTANDLHMIVIVGIFYQAVPLPPTDVVHSVVATVTKSLQPFHNVIINVANEQNSGKWKDSVANFDMRSPAKTIELCTIVKANDSKRIVGAGGYNPENNEEIGKSPNVDVLLFDTSHTAEDSKKLYERYLKKGVKRKPMINVEIFGGSTKPFLPPGVFSTAKNATLKEAYLREINAAAGIPNLGLFLHNNPWFQGVKDGDKLHYEIGGTGDEKDPGFRWYFDAVQKTSAPVETKPATPAQ